MRQFNSPVRSYGWYWFGIMIKILRSPFKEPWRVLRMIKENHALFSHIFDLYISQLEQPNDQVLFEMLKKV